MLQVKMDLISQLLLNKGYEVHGVKKSSSFNPKIDHIYEDHTTQKFILYGDVTIHYLYQQL